MTDSTLKEPGCTGYQLYQNPYDKTSFLVFETYKNQAAIEAHFAASYFKAFGDKIGPLTSKPNEIVIYDVKKK
jgi:quinol monooxygenase YgiN